jgi:ATP-dependent RNA helicase RhlE
LQNTAFTRTLVFARTKHGADKIVKQLIRAGIRAAAIHGNKSQNVRQRTLDAFKSNRPPILVATDVAARGLDVDGISHVINFDLPDVAEMYVHRIGRTARAGASGIATSFCAREERDQLRQIERLTRRTLVVEHNQPVYPREATPVHTPIANGKRAANLKSQRPLTQGAITAPRPGGGRPTNAKRRHFARGRRSA